MWNEFEKCKDELYRQYDEDNWGFGAEPETLKAEVGKIMSENISLSAAKAKAVSYIMRNVQLDINKNEFFADKINHAEIMGEFLWRGIDSLTHNEEKETAEKAEKLITTGCITAGFDLGHIAPDWDFLMQNGIPGTIRRLEECKASNPEKSEFYDECLTVYGSIKVLLARMASAAEACGTEKSRFTAHNLRSLAEYPPMTLAQAMQLTFIIYNVTMAIDNTTIRSLGGIDHLYYPFYKSDLESGRFTDSRLRELTRDFLWKLSAKKVVANVPFYICGTDSEGNDYSNEYTKVLIEEYLSLDIYDPKFHVLYSENTNTDILNLIFEAIRSGKNSFVFINTASAKNALEKIGISPEDAKRITVYGCYETSAEGTEVPCTCGAYVNLPKALELALYNGRELATNRTVGEMTGENFKSFEEFYDAVKIQLEFLTKSAMNINTAYEKHYAKILSSPLLSSTYKCSAESGIDLYHGGAKYNNTSIIGSGLATLADSLIAVKTIVFEEHKAGFEELKKILSGNWKDCEALRMYCVNKLPKYGNNLAEADGYAKDITDFFSGLINGQSNGRGGVFRCGIFSVNMRFNFGNMLCATPDGRRKGEPTSKNAAASVGQDKNGVTAYLNSILKLDFSAFPDGCVADAVLHCSAVRGDDGLNALKGLMVSYMKRGGSAIHFNVLNPEELKKAQAEPEKYKNLQIRLCGWNVHFVDLSRKEQDEFILQSQNQ